jgi:hypothetical protein
MFIPFGNNTPNWILWIARIFPVKHFADGMQAGFLGTAFHWTDVLVVAAWAWPGWRWPCASSAGSPAGADRRPGVGARGRSPGAHKRQHPSGHYRPGVGRLGC